ncbi:hypothetical protein [Paenibacillus senegalensis]|uniref:hypothetical protein n=1 Tax=Paenibacillus senegalensis TaxID=1465766 RepID=UPI0002882F3A|nr:hypothetical protein [Paenibacillus senegalensis]
MREIKIGEQTVRIKAAPLALLYYKQEFEADLLGDLTSLQTLKEDPTKIDTVLLLQLVWAMAKCEAYGSQREHPSFFEWVGSLESIDFNELSNFVGILEEAENGFFRSARGTKAAKAEAK